MTKLLILASLLAACAVTPASAEPMKAPTPVPIKETVKKCQPNGTPIFQANKTTRDGKGGSSVDAIFDNGAWEHEETGADKKTIKSDTGKCLSDAQLKDAKTALKDAKWTITTDKIKCMAMSNDVTIYTAGKTEVFRDTLCSGKHLDDKSAAALKTLLEVLKGPATAPAPTAK